MTSHTTVREELKKELCELDGSIPTKTQEKYLKFLLVKLDERDEKIRQATETLIDYSQVGNEGKYGFEWMMIPKDEWDKFIFFIHSQEKE